MAKVSHRLTPKISRFCLPSELTPSASKAELDQTIFLVVTKKLMHRSPIALYAVLFVVLSALSAGAQSNPATPQSGSSLPNTQVPPSQAPVPAPKTPPAPIGSMPNATPTPTPTATPTPSPSPSASPTPSPTATPTPEASQTDDATPKSASPSPTSTPPIEPQVAHPKTDILDSSATGGALATDGHDPILDPPPLPKTTTTLLGGTISGVDRMRNKLSIKIFGGNTWTVNFDERTHIFHNGAETTQLALKKGERVYVDTQLDNNQHDIFARNIRVGVVTLPADADGQIVDVDFRHREVMLRDVINSVPVRFGVNDETRISNGQNPVTLEEVQPGALVHVRFAPENPNRGLAREIDILARPGANFTFAGRVTFLDVHRGIMAVQNLSDDKNYEIRFTSTGTVDRASLNVGIEVRVVATFEGSRYTAQSVVIIKKQDVLEKEK